MKIVKKNSTENYHFYSRDLLQYIARTCLRNEINLAKTQISLGICPVWPSLTRVFAVCLNV